MVDPCQISEGSTVCTAECCHLYMTEGTYDFHGIEFKEKEWKLIGMGKVEFKNMQADDSMIRQNGGSVTFLNMIITCVLNSNARGYVYEQNGGQLYLQNSSFTSCSRLLHSSSDSNIDSCEFRNVSTVDDEMIHHTGTMLLNTSIFHNIKGTAIKTHGNVELHDCIFKYNGNVDQNGGCINSNGGNVTIYGGEYSYNEALNGGFLYFVGGTVWVHSGQFDSNSAEQYGGVFSCSEGPVNIFGGTFRSNSANGGGGVVSLSSSGEINILGGNFSFNIAIGGGGVVSSLGAKITITDGIFHSNRAYGGGGVVVCYGNTITILNGLFELNFAVGGGGAISSFGGEVHIQNGIFNSNFVKGVDGGILIESGNGAVIFSTRNVYIRNGNFTSNHAHLGGVLFTIEFGEIHIENGTFYFNKANVGTIIYSSGDGVNIRSGIFKGNSAKSGGLFHCDTSNVVVSKSLFEFNSAKVGHLFDIQGHGYFDNCQFRSNVGKYGAIFNANRLTLISVSCSNNTALVGGGVFVVKSHLNVTMSIFNNNHAPNGGVGIIEGSAMISSSNFSLNSAEKDGGVFDCGFGACTLKNSTFLNNIAGKFGGVVIGYRDVFIDNCQFKENQAQRGGVGCFRIGNNVKIKESLFFRNSADSSGGVFFELRGQMHIWNSQFTNNFAENGIIFSKLSNVALEGSSFSRNIMQGLGNLGNIYVDRGSIDCRRNKFNSNVFGGDVTLQSSKGLFIDNQYFNSSNLGNGGCLTILFCNIDTPVEIKNDMFQSCQSYGIGGCISVENSHVQTKNISLRGCIADAGGGLRIVSSNVQLNDSKIRNNAARSDTFGHGGGIYIDADSNVSLKNSVLSKNTATEGGAIYFDSGSLHMADCIIEENKSSKGAGLHLRNGNVSMKDMKVRGNVATDSGAGMWTLNTHFTSPCSGIFENNHAHGIGGAIYCHHQESLSQWIQFSFDHNIADVFAHEIFINSVLRNQTRYLDYEHLKLFNLPSILHVIAVNDVSISNARGPIPINIDSLFSVQFHVEDLFGHAFEKTIFDERVELLVDSGQFIIPPQRSTLDSFENLRISTTSVLPANSFLEIRLKSDQELKRLIPIVLMPCVRGSIHVQSHGNSSVQCDICPPGTYSILKSNESRICHPCTKLKATCRGGDEVVVDKGYYLFQNHDKLVVRKCIEASLCRGSHSENRLKNNCSKYRNFDAPFCRGCKDGFSHERGICIHCNRKFNFLPLCWYLFKRFLLLFSFFLFSEQDSWYRMLIFNGQTIGYLLTINGRVWMDEMRGTFSGWSEVLFGCAFIRNGFGDLFLQCVESILPIVLFTLFKIFKDVLRRCFHVMDPIDPTGGSEDIGSENESVDTELLEECDHDSSIKEFELISQESTILLLENDQDEQKSIIKSALASKYVFKSRAKKILTSIFRTIDSKNYNAILLNLVLFSYMPVVDAVMSFFFCVKVPGKPTCVLLRYTKIKCYSTNYWLWLWIMYIPLLVFWVLGLPIVLFVISKFSKANKFGSTLVAPYTNSGFWRYSELWSLIFRLLFVLCIHFGDLGIVEGIPIFHYTVLLMILISGHCIIYYWKRPFKTEICNRFQIVISVVLCFVLVLQCSLEGDNQILNQIFAMILGVGLLFVMFGRMLIEVLRNHLCSCSKWNKLKE